MLFQDRYYLSFEGMTYFLAQSYVPLVHLVEFRILHMFNFFPLCDVKWGVDEEIIFSCELGHLSVCLFGIGLRSFDICDYPVDRVPHALVLR